MQSTVKEYKLPASFTADKQEKLFSEIVELYDLADEVLVSVAEDTKNDRNVLMGLVKPVITQITNSTNILSSFYTEVVRNGRPITPELRDTIGAALRNIFITIKEYADGVEEKLMPGKK